MNERSVNILSRKVDVIRLRLKRLQKYRLILSDSLASELAKSGGFRNVLAHLYDEIIPVKVIIALSETLELYPEYLSKIQSYLDLFEN